jgi:FixJ family two-component response regulator
MTEQPPVVFVIDDDPSTREAIGDLLGSVGLQVRLFGSTQDFLASERPDAPGCLVLDVRLPGPSGLDFQRELAQSAIALPPTCCSIAYARRSKRARRVGGQA